MAQVNNTNNELKRTMKSRHLFMIALGGVIGTGLFNGSGFIISQAGPGGSVLAFMAGGLLMYFVMLCLGELAVAMPVSGLSRNMPLSLSILQLALQSDGCIG